MVFLPSPLVLFRVLWWHYGNLWIVISYSFGVIMRMIIIIIFIRVR